MEPHAEFRWHASLYFLSFFSCMAPAVGKTMADGVGSETPRCLLVLLHRTFGELFAKFWGPEISKNLKIRAFYLF